MQSNCDCWVCRQPRKRSAFSAKVLPVPECICRYSKTKKIQCWQVVTYFFGDNIPVQCKPPAARVVTLHNGVGALGPVHRAITEMKLRKFWKNKSTAPSYESTASYDAILGLKAGHAPKRSRAVPKSSKNAVQRLGHHKHDGEFFSYDSTTPTTWSWSLSKIKSSRPKRRLKPRVSGNLRKNLGDATWLNRDVRLKFQQEEQLRNSLVSKKHFIRPVRRRLTFCYTL